MTLPTGIEPSAGLDPANTTAFVTGLTFAGSGRFTGTQVPITAQVAALPEPGSAALTLLELTALGLARHAKKRSRRCRAGVCTSARGAAFA